MDTDTGSSSPQFETVEYTATPGNCVLCNQPISGQYYRINGEQACSKCAERERVGQRDNATNYSRALVFGIVAAIIGMAGYAAFEIITGWIIGYVALAVGWFVGKAMLVGSKGRGGRKYQITAALLTYAAVSLAAIPLWIYQNNKLQKEHNQVQVRQQATTEQGTGAEGGSTTSEAAVTDTTKSANTKEEQMGIGKALAMLLLIGLASPFLELASPIHGLIGLVILFVGIQIAWKMTGRRDLAIDGPF